MKNRELARLYYNEISKIQLGESSFSQKTKALSKLLSEVVIEATKQERIAFTTFFARIAYLCHKVQISSRRQFYIHAFRRAVSDIGMQKPLAAGLDEETVFLLGIKVVAELVKVLYEEDIPHDLYMMVRDDKAFRIKPAEITAHHTRLRVVIIEDDAINEQLLGRDEAQGGAEVRIRYNIPDYNANFNNSIKVIRMVFGYPLAVNLLDVDVDVDGVYRPRAIIIEPDYLMDVTSISESFRDYGIEVLPYLSKKFLPYEQSKALMLGNIANFFLDELIVNPDQKFTDLFPKVFRLNPLAFCQFEAKVVREIQEESQKHFSNLRDVIINGFSTLGIQKEDCYLEPSFYSEQYGIQGRLDLLYKNNENTKQSAIVELKSGKPFKPNLYGITHTHYMQTLLYDLIVKSAFKDKAKPTNYILYSVLDVDRLKFAPATKAQQYEALQARNMLLAVEQSLINIKQEELGSPTVFNKLNTQSLAHLKGYDYSNIVLFETTFQAMTELERRYFIAFSAFIAREHRLAKTGIQGIENANGLASLWLNPAYEKDENYDMIRFLTIAENKSQEADALIIFNKTSQTNPLANFRQGDIVVLYPADDEDATVLDNQIFKCTITDIAKESITVRLRSRQFNTYIFEHTRHWNIERDLLDSSFTGMYRSLFEFARASSSAKDLLLTARPPAQALDTPLLAAPSEMTSEQLRIFRKVINAQDYFLLWGPPGTGKTSMMLKHLVGYLIANTEEQILLLAYTNRAVDEICEAIAQLAKEIQQEQNLHDDPLPYLRIGSRFSTAPQFHTRLLDQQLESIKNRKDLRELIDNHRIVVATVASMTGKMELLQLKKFDRIIIDEASQILEPNLVGLLASFQKMVLIGDHKQLPAVVSQDNQASAVSDDLLKSVGLDNLRNSLFERLYKRCQAMGWHWAYDQLSHQGRMHQDIMRFPAQYFYEGTLQILPEEVFYHRLQVSGIAQQLPEVATKLDSQLLSRRMVYVPTDIDPANTMLKTNVHEARMILELVQRFKAIYAANDMPLHAGSIGIITPYRAQIACILAEFRAHNEDTELLTIDTVERYQGGARDVILISLCVNKLSQMASLVSLSEEGVDRKLNVAITRARHHLVILGNRELLMQNTIYAQLITHCEEGSNV